MKIWEMFLMLAISSGIMIWCFSWMEDEMQFQQAEHAAAMEQCMATGKQKWECYGYLNGCKESGKIIY